MASDLIRIIKQASLDAFNNSKPSDLRFGTVASVAPLSVRVTNEFIIPESMLIVPEHLTDREVEVTLEREYLWETHIKQGISGGYDDIKILDNYSENEDDYERDVINHNHEIFGTRKIKIHNGLKSGDKVALLRKQGGQSYFILDRI